MKVSFFAHWDAPTAVEAARACERHGVDGFWVDESLWQLAALPIASACAQATERIGIGIGILTPYMMHPTYFAMHHATLAELSKGRSTIALAAGVESWLGQVGIPQRYPRTAVKEAIEVTRSMLAGGPTTYAGKVLDVRDVEMGFRADEYPAPLLWGAMGPRSIETAGEVADGWLISVMEPLASVQRGMERLRAGAAKAGRDVDDLNVIQYFVFACDDDSATARSQAKSLIDHIARVEFDYFVGQESFVDAFTANLEGITTADYVAIMQRLAAGASPDDAIPDRLVEQVAIAGTPEECAAQLRRYEEAGVTEAALKPAVLDLERIPRVIGEQIKPLLA